MTMIQLCRNLKLDSVFCNILIVVMARVFSGSDEDLRHYRGARCSSTNLQLKVIINY
jgi:hypothetical protein